MNMKYLSISPAWSLNIPSQSHFKNSKDVPFHKVRHGLVPWRVGHKSNLPFKSRSPQLLQGQLKDVKGSLQGISLHCFGGTGVPVFKKKDSSWEHIRIGSSKPKRLAF